MLKWDYAEGRYILARLDHGAEIISQISDLARDAKIEVGVFGVIGALSQAELSYYDQDSLQYGRILIEEPVELVSCSGNISEKDDRPFVHAHAVLADREGKVLGRPSLQRHDLCCRTPLPGAFGFAPEKRSRFDNWPKPLEKK